MSSRRNFLQAAAVGLPTGSALLQGAGTQPAPEDLEVYMDGKLCKARSQLSGTVRFSTPSADEAIQKAVGSFGGLGGEVLLHRGRFELNRQINLPAGVTLRGKGAGTSLWIGKQHDTGVAVFAEGVQDVTVADLSIMSDRGAPSTGVVFDSMGTSVVRDILCVDLSEYGIWIRNKSFLCEVRGCKVGGAGKSGIFLDHLTRGGRGGDFIPNLVANCIVYAGGVGIETSEAIVANLVGCEVFQTRGPGFHLHSASNSVLISGCRTFQIQDDAVRVENSHELNISSNIFCWHLGHGIVLKDVTWGTIAGNEVIDTGSVNQDFPANQYPSSLKLMNGIYLISTSGVGVTGNTIFNWPVAPPIGHAILEEGSCRNSVIVANNINYARVGVQSDGKGSQTANNVAYLPESYNPNHRNASVRMQTFDPKLMQQFLERQRGDRSI